MQDFFSAMDALGDLLQNKRQSSVDRSCMLITGIVCVTAMGIGFVVNQIDA